MLLLLGTVPGVAVDYYWTNGAGGDYGTAGNWAPGNILPGVLDNAKFTNNTTLGVTLGSSATASNAFFDATRDGGNFTLGLGGVTLTLSNALSVSASGGATNVLTLTNGTVLAAGSANATVGVASSGSSSSVGTLVLGNGAFVVVTNGVNSNVVLGNGAGATGTLIGTNGGSFLVTAVNLAASTGSRGAMNLYGGTYTLNGNGSGALSVGTAAGGTGSVVVAGNTSFLITTNAGTGGRIGAGGYGTVTVSNGGTWLAGAIVVGNTTGNGLFVVTNGGRLFSSAVTVGSGSGVNGPSNNTMIVGGGSLWTNSGNVSFGANNATISNTLWITDPGTTLTNGAAVSVGANGASTANRFIVTNSATVVSKGVLTVGSGSSSNTAAIFASGSWNMSAQATVVGSGAATGNVLLVNGGLVTNSGFTVGSGASSLGNALVVTNGGVVVQSGTLAIARAAAGSNFVIVAGANNGTQALINANSSAVFVGTEANSVGNWMRVDSGGLVTNIGGQGLILGNAAGAVGNYLIVTNGGRISSINTSGVNVGKAAGANSNFIVVAAGGSMELATNPAFSIGSGATTGMTGNYVRVDGGMISNTGVIYVGAKSNSVGNALIVANGGRVYGAGVFVGGAGGGDNNSVLVASGGLIEGTALSNYTAGVGNTISNIGGIFQFTSTTPTVSTNGGGNFIAMAGGTVAFRGVSGALLTGQITNISYSGANTLRLDASTNAALSYVFSNNLAFSALELVNSGSLWQGPSLLIGAGGLLRASNGTATVGSVLTNAGTVSVINGSLTYLSNVVLNGGLFLTQNGTNNFTRGLGLASGAALTFTSGSSYVSGAITNSGTMNAVNANVTFGGPVVISGLYSSDPSTNIFTSNVTVTASGALQGGVGDLFVFQKDLINQSTNAAQFHLSQSAVLFSNGPAHLLSLSNSGSADLGQGFTNFSQVANNFSIGQLSIALGDRMTLAGNKDSFTNALYVGWLDIQGIDTNSYTSVTNGLFAALNLPNINLYYDKYDSRNNWLNANLINSSAAGYNLWNGGLLLPIPEPSAFLLLSASLGLLTFLRRRGA